MSKISKMREHREDFAAFLKSDGFKLCEIADALNVSSTRASQIFIRGARRANKNRLKHGLPKKFPEVLSSEEQLQKWHAEFQAR